MVLTDFRMWNVDFGKKAGTDNDLPALIDNEFCLFYKTIAQDLMKFHLPGNILPIAPILHHSITPSLQHSITPPRHNSNTPSRHYFTTPPLQLL